MTTVMIIFRNEAAKQGGIPSPYKIMPFSHVQQTLKENTYRMYSHVFILM